MVATTKSRQMPRSSTSRDSPRVKTPDPYRLGEFVARWIEANCVLGEGDYFGEPFVLRSWQRAIVRELYRLNPDGSRKYRRALIGLPKGNGKTPIAAAIGAYELAGGSHISPVVPVSAATFEQADLVFGDMKTIFRESPTLASFVEVYDTEIVLKGQPGRAFRVAAARGSNDGSRPTCYIADELHEFNDPQKEGAHLVLANGTAKRADSLQLNITTAGADLDSLLGRMYLHGKKIEAGEITDPTFLFVWYEGSSNVNVADPVALRAAIRECNPAADDFLDVEEIAGRFDVIPEFEARRYYLNQWTRVAESWLPAGAWSACLGDATIPSGSPVYVGIDMALFHDSTAVCVAWPHLNSNNETVVTVNSKVWEPVDGRIDHYDVKQFLRKLARTFDVQRFAADPRLFELIGTELQDEGLPVLDFPQSPERMYPACSNTYELIAGRRLIHNGDATLTDHVLSAVQRKSEYGWSLSKGRSKRKIDAAMALVMATYEATRTEEPINEPAQIMFWL
jgi:phage terminase large subunit-like protein